MTTDKVFWEAAGIHHRTSSGRLEQSWKGRGLEVEDRSSSRWDGKGQSQILNTCFEILIGLTDMADLVSTFKIWAIWKPEASRESLSLILSSHIFILSYPRDLVNKMNADVPAS